MKIYQVQFKNQYGEWCSFNAHHQYDILFTQKDAEELYDQMIAYHQMDTWNGITGHRIACWEVSDLEVLKEEE